MTRDPGGRARQVYYADAPGASVSRPVILAVGDVVHWQEAGRTLPADGQIEFADFHDVTATLLETLQPDIVLSPLLAASFDCIDLAQVLADAAFLGRYRAISPPLPSPNIVRKEIRALCPSLDFDIVVFTGEGKPRLS